MTLLAAAAVTAVPAGASTSPYVAYEAVRVKAGGASQIPFRVRASGGGLFTQLELEPRGSGYASTDVSFTEMSGGSTDWLWLVHPKPGHRYFLAGPRGHLSIIRLSGYWKVRPVSLGIRTVAPAQSDQDTYHVGAGTLTVFRSASAPGGPYGSLAVADFPCAAGRWSFGTDAEPGETSPCVLGSGSAQRETSRSGRWSLSGTTVGGDDATYRLIVVDFPKR